MSGKGCEKEMNGKCLRVEFQKIKVVIAVCENKCVLSKVLLNLKN